MPLGASSLGRIPSLRGVRSTERAFDGAFFQKSSAFWPIVRAARHFASRSDWPEVEEYDALLERPSVCFRPARGRPRRRPHPVEPRTLYDGRIVLDGVVPTRAGSWHDYLNALVWAAFPQAKLALHRRQLAELVREVEQNDGRLPGARTKSHDAVAAIDEGGVILVRAKTEVPILFGHALFEELALRARSVVPRAMVIDAPEVPDDPVELLAAADAGLARRLTEPELRLRELPVVPLGRAIDWAENHFGKRAEGPL